MVVRGSRNENNEENGALRFNAYQCTDEGAPVTSMRGSTFLHGYGLGFSPCCPDSTRAFETNEIILPWPSITI